MKKNKLLEISTGLILRGSIGLSGVYFINTFLDGYGIVAQVGLNLVTAVTTAVLGIPGIGLLYGITFFQIL